MRNFKFCAVFLILLTSKTKGQYYGEQRYPHPNSYLSSGMVVAPIAGYVMAGYTPFSNAVTPLPDFVIDKSGADLLFPSLTTDFSNEYEIYDAVNCSGSSSRLYNCVGVSVIETSTMGFGERYVVTGAYSEGVFVAMLDALGAVLYSYRWNFPNSTGTYGQPMIREAISSSGSFYICGDFNNDTYVIKLSGGGAVTPIWANWYSNGGRLIARDVIERLPGVIVVGRADLPNTTTAADAFVMDLNAGGGLNSATNYNRQYDGDDWLASIDYAMNSPNPGFIMGGHSRFPFTLGGTVGNTSFTQWMAKIDYAGNLVWSALILPNATALNIFSGWEISDVFERYKPSQNTCEYYGVAGSFVIPGGTIQDNLVVYRLDVNGAANLSPDEFHFQNGNGPTTSSFNTKARLSDINTNNVSGEDGFQAYGNTGNTDHFLAKAYFNGATGCDTAVDILRMYTGPTAVGNFNVVVSPFNATCQQGLFNLVMIPTVNVPSAACTIVSNVQTGSNARPTGLTDLSKESRIKGLNIFPNPVKQKAVITFNKATSDSKVSVEIYSALGSKIDVSMSDNNPNGIEIDFKDSKIASGVYFAKVTIGSVVSHAKFVYSGE